MYFYFWYFKYILMLISLYFCFSKILKEGLLLVFLHCGITTFNKVQDLSTSSTTGTKHIHLNSLIGRFIQWWKKYLDILLK